jgi:hypothetical protein
MVALLFYYFLFGIGAIAIGLVVYKVFDKILDVVSDFVNSF